MQYSQASDTFRKYVFWLPLLPLGLWLIHLRLSTDYASDSPLGVGLGATAFLLVVLSAVAGWLRKKPRPIGPLAVKVHAPLAAMALMVALAHWHFRGREMAGLLSAALLLLVFSGLTFSGFRRSRMLKQLHKYGGYLLIVCVLVHMAHALFFAGS